MGNELFDVGQSIFTTNLPTPGHFVDRISKAAPVIVVESPEAEANVRRFFAGQKFRIVRAFKNDGLEGLAFVMLRTPAQKAKGLIGMSPIPSKVLFVFPDIGPGMTFHSRGVLEPFDIVFLDRSGVIIDAKRVTPSGGLATAPPGTRSAVEAKAGTFVAST
jgi:uncharacterized membrane protein (UPF0127 family)